MEPRKLKINFILPFKSLNGGVKVVLEYANHLTALDHCVTIIYPLIPYFFGKKKFSLKDRWWQVRGFLANLIRGNKIQWFDLKAKLIRVPWIAERFLQEADIIVATAWITAYSVAKLSRAKGEKFYFIQGYETWHGQVEKVENSYRLPLKKIVIASWLKRLMEKKFGDRDVPLITNGVNLTHFFNDGKKFNRPPRILLMHHEAEFKGVKDALNALEIVRKRKPDIKVILFGTKKASAIPEGVEFHLKPFGENLRQLYCSSDIFISPGWIEGCQLPPMEAMACQCAVVASNVGGIPDYAIPGETALVFEPRDLQAMADHIIHLLENPDELKRISFAGYEHIKHFTWDCAAKKMEQIFLDALTE